jgi:Tol biopolymer transport system component
MRRYFSVTGAALAAIIVMMPSAGASRGREWSEPVNIGQTINTPFEEAGPAISKDGRVLYFQTNNTANGTCDIWVAQRETVQHEWNLPEPLAAINTDNCENSVSLSRDEHHLFFTRPPGDIYVSYRRDVRDPFGWEAPVRLGPSINTDTASESTARHFASAKHGLSQLYFFSNRPGGAGDADIYFADLFGAPSQRVAELNSPQIDAGAVLSRNGLEIFFHSNRPGIGGRDLWTATRKSVFEPWATPTNMDSLNTTGEEWFPALSADDDTLYFVSNRPGTFGGSDIYVTTRITHGKR